MARPTLAPCLVCRRHVRVTETACPFCASPLESAPTPRGRQPTTQRLSRAAVMFGVTAALGAGVGCAADGDGGAPALGDDPADAGDGGSAGAGGEGGAAGDGDAPYDVGTAVPHYGTPGCDAAGPPSGAGGPGSALLVASALLAAAARTRRRR